MLVTALLLALASDTAPPPVPSDAKVKTGLEQVREGRLDAAVATFDEAIGELSKAGPSGRGDLLVAYVHKGAALVALQKEDVAKEAFRQALALQSTLRLQKGEFPDRVVRVFDAARTGKTESVMERPSGAPKKAGIGAAGIAAIVGGGILLAGGAAAVAAGGETPAPATTPIPSPTPDPRTQVVPTTRTGPVEITFVAAVPSPGGVVSGCGTDARRCGGRFTIGLRLFSSIRFRGSVVVDLIDAARRSCLKGASGVDFLERQTIEVAAGFGNEAGEPCVPPITIVEMLARVGVAPLEPGNRSEDSTQSWTISYTINP